MSNSLIYSPSFDGHRQVYIFVITNILQELGFKIFIAGDTKQIISNSFYIDKLKKCPEIKIIDTSKFDKGGINISTDEFLKLQNECEADLTVFPEADHHISLFVSQISNKRKRFRGKIVGLFLRPFFYYEHNGLFDKLRYLKNLPSRWRNDNQLFHEFFLKQFSLLNIALYIDENFVNHQRYGQWIPDVFQQYADIILQDEKAENRSWIGKLDGFKAKNKGKFLLLYFGTAQSRRGYDIILKIAEENNACFIHCGLRNNNEQFTYDINKLRSSLAISGRLFETDEFIEDPISIEYFFKSVSHMVLPYRQFFGSSGVMLQALNYGIPVMAPDAGIIGYRIKKYKLGITYNDKNPKSLNTQFNIFKNLDPKEFENNIKSYMNFQSTEQLKKVLINAFTASDQPVRQSILNIP